MLRLRSVGVLSAAKISALLYGGLSLLFVPLLLIMAAVMTLVPKAENQPPAILFVVFAVFAPVIYGLIGFITGALMAFIYNLVAGWVGGLELQFESSLTASAPAASPIAQP